MTQLAIAALDDSPNVIAQLTEMLVDVVAGGASVSFMHPLDRGIARTFWETAFASAKRKECLILGMWDGDTLAGTVTVNLAMPQNQQHRAEIAKLITHPNYRGRGIASNLMQVAERAAIADGRTLLMLDTAEDGGASALYDRLGFTLAGSIPDFALRPKGGMTATLLYWKRIGSRSL